MAKNDSKNNAINEMDKLAKARNYFVKDFVNYLAVERNLSPRTVKEYKHDLKIFFKYFKPFLDSELTLEAIDEKTIREFLTHLIIEKNYSPRALNRKLSTLKGYFRFLEEEGYIEKTPLRRIKTVKMGKHFPKVFSPKDVDKMIESPEMDDVQDEDENKRSYRMPFKASVRDRAILEVFYATGMRISELSGMNLEDIDFDSMLIKVTGKGDKQRMVIMNNAAAEALQDWLRERPDAGSAVFINRNKKRLAPRGIQKMFKKRKIQAGIQAEGSPHTMRHSFATHLLEGGADLVSIKELLGHESLSTTQIYTNIAMTRIKKVYNEAQRRK